MEHLLSEKNIYIINRYIVSIVVVTFLSLHFENILNTLYLYLIHMLWWCASCLIMVECKHEITINGNVLGTIDALKQPLSVLAKILKKNNDSLKFVLI